MPVVPALVALSVLSRYRRTWIALGILGVIMQIPTVFGTPERYDALMGEKGHSEESAVWHPQTASTVGMWRSAVDQVRDAEHTDIRQFTGYRPSTSRLADGRNFRIVPLWWWMLPLVGVPRILGIVVSASLVITGIWIIKKSVNGVVKSVEATDNAP